jgi:hypothetical protein
VYIETYILYNYIIKMTQSFIERFGYESTFFTDFIIIMFGCMIIGSFFTIFFSNFIIIIMCASIGIGLLFTVYYFLSCCNILFGLKWTMCVFLLKKFD